MQTTVQQYNNKIQERRKHPHENRDEETIFCGWIFFHYFFCSLCPALIFHIWDFQRGNSSSFEKISDKLARQLCHPNWFLCCTNRLNRRPKESILDADWDFRTKKKRRE
jgi:hypothetical protein